MNFQKAVENLRDSVPSGVWRHPGAVDAYIFLVTEVGEIGDLLMRSGYADDDYVRNREGMATHQDFEHELGDAQLMLCTLAIRLGVDLEDALNQRISSLLARYADTKEVMHDAGNEAHEDVCG